MRILLVHSYYQQRGGEDAVFDREAALLRDRGVDVVPYVRHNNEIDELSKLTAGMRAFWNREVYRDLRRVIRETQPTVMHCTNIFPLLSPSTYIAARREGVPVVQSVHNYRPAGCINGLFLRNGRVCEDCLTKRSSLPGLLHRCYRGSLASSAVAALSLNLHRWLGTQANSVACWIALTDFARDKLIASGLDSSKVVVKPNFLDPIPEVGTGLGGYAVFVGRLSHEKGLFTLLEGWKRLRHPFPLKILGTGPDEQHARQFASEMPHVTFLGAVPPSQVLETVRNASFLVFPSTWYEVFPLTILEAYACGTPVIGSRIGNMKTLIVDTQTGYHFDPGNAESLAETVERALSSPEQLSRMRLAAREWFDKVGTPDHNFRQLMDIYRRVAGDTQGIASLPLA